nr:putative RNA-directed DNA polymerase, eukaryota, reverse transcriptase zinc-binding domain protein [Tanacetum cinerariifolium]
MGSQRTKEEDVQKISISVFITNFPDSFTAKDLFKICSQYGNVVDAYIPNKRSKIGKRFGLVRFRKVLNVKRLVNNLCMLWVGRYRLHTNIVRFQRTYMNKNNSHDTKKYEENRSNLRDYNKDKWVNDFANSYINAVKGGNQSVNAECSQPALVLDESCFLNQDFSLSLVGILKEFDSLPNLKNILEEDSNDDSSELDNESIEDKSKDGYSDKDSEAVEIHETFLEVEEPGEIKCSATKEIKNKDVEDVHFDDPFNLYNLLEKKQTSMLRFNQKGNQNTRRGSHLKISSDTNSHGPDNQVHGTSVKEHGFKNSTILDYFIAIMGKWIPNEKNFLIISVYASQKLSEKRMLWQYLVHVIEGWKGNIIVMGDFNEVRTTEERFGSIFNARGAASFNSFISTGGLVEVPSGGYSYTWVYKFATKFSKLDRFLISEDLMRNCPNISSIILDRYLSDHRPILLLGIRLDYGPTLFRFFHYWFELDGFDSFVTEVWKEINIQDPNAMLKPAKKLKIIKGHIRLWVKDKKDKATILKNSLKKKLAAIDSILDNEEATSLALEDQLNAMNNLTNLERMKSIELAQKAKIKWSIEGDENSKKFHGIINKQRNNLAIRGIIVDGQWIEDPMMVKNEFLTHFKDRFDSPCKNCLILYMIFPNKISSNQIFNLERPFLIAEIKGVVWDCGLNKSPGPDGFTFGNASFIALIPKSPGAKMVKDFRPISLIRSLYKIIAKLLANRLVTIVGDLVNEVQYAFIANRQILDGPFIFNEIIHWCKARKKQSMIFKVDFKKAFDSVRWDFLDDILNNFGFGLKQGNPLSSLLSILVMESLHLPFHNVVTAGLFNGIVLDPTLQLSHLFYADDVVFLGHWSESNLSTIIHVLDCFFRAFCLRINLHKSKLIGIVVDSSLVYDAANKIGCMAIKLPFSYLGLNIGDHMSRINAWDNVINKVLFRLSKWKMKSLSISGRLTLLKSGLGSTHLYYMSMFKVPIQVLKKLESIRSHFFNGVDPNVRKMTFVKWSNVLASKKKGGLGVPIFYGLNRALIFKIYSLEIDKSISVASKMAHSSVFYSLRRTPRGGEQFQMEGLNSYLESTIMSSMIDRWRWTLSGDGEFSVSSVMCLIDDKTLATIGSKTRWIKYVPSKVNILAWRIKHDFLSTCLNISRRGIELDFIFCTSCILATESSSHILFACPLVKVLYKNIARWWDVNMTEMSSYEEW